MARFKFFVRYLVVQLCVFCSILFLVFLVLRSGQLLTLSSAFSCLWLTSLMDNFLLATLAFFFPLAASLG